MMLFFLFSYLFIFFCSEGLSTSCVGEVSLERIPLKGCTLVFNHQFAEILIKHCACAVICYLLVTAP